MTVIDTRLSTKVEAAFRGGPSRMTWVNTLANGVERRTARWSQPRHRYIAAYANFTATQRAELLAAAHATEGMLYGFRFKDWNDFEAVGVSLGNAPAGSTAVQLVKPYTFGATTYTRTITRPVAGTVTVYQAGVAKAGSIDTTTGLFTPTTAWTEGQALTADFEFDVPVRFAADFFEFSLPFRDISEATVELIEVFNE